MAKKKLPPGARVFEEHPSPTRTVFRVWLTSKFLGQNMAPERRGFASLEAAHEWIWQRHDEIRPHLAEARKSELTMDQVSDAKAALAKLAGRASLVEAAFFWDSQHAAGISKTVEDAITALHGDKETAGNSHRHCVDIKAKLKRLLRGHEKTILSALTKDEIRLAVDAKDAKGKAPSLSQRVKRLRYFSILATFAIRQGWLTKSPADAISKPRLSSKRPAILTPDQSKKILETAKEKMPNCLSSLALKLFAGVRTSELVLATWEELKPDTLRVWKTKTGRPRSITVEQALLRWLPADRPKTGLIFTYHPEIVNDRPFAWIEAQRELQKLSGVKIPQNALRHSFGTYHRQRGKDTARTAVEMGNSPAVVERNYADAVSDSEAAEFWAL